MPLRRASSISVRSLSVLIVSAKEKTPLGPWVTPKISPFGLTKESTRTCGVAASAPVITRSRASVSVGSRRPAPTSFARNASWSSTGANRLPIFVWTASRPRWADWASNSRVAPADMYQTTERMTAAVRATSAAITIASVRDREMVRFRVSASAAPVVCKDMPQVGNGATYVMALVRMIVLLTIPALFPNRPGSGWIGEGCHVMCIAIERFCDAGAESSHA
ncbi:hypothetical protein D9M72_507000 [compost metagenome]